jgi:tetratricopeptide (TPR) repeat protein
VPPEEVADHYRDRCLTCHKLDDCRLKEMGAAMPTNVKPDNCVACHMPGRRTQDVVQVVMTDHLITRRIEGDALAELHETPPPQGARAEFYFPARAPPEPERSIDLALSAAGDGDLGAISVLESLLDDAAPAQPRPYLELAEAQLKAGRFDRALRTLAAAPQPPSAAALTNAGVGMAGLGQPQEAASLLERALQINPDLPDAHFNLALTLARLGRDDEALAHYQTALRLRPNHAKAWLNLGNLHARAERYRDAAEAYRQALSIDPGLAAAYRNLGSALRRLDDWPEAMRVWRHGWMRRPEHWPIALDLAMACLTAPDAALRDPAEALRLAEAAAQIAPAVPQPAEVLALALLDNGRHEEALGAAERAAALGSDRATVLLIRALSEHAAGRRDDAQAAWREAAGALAAGPPGNRLQEALRRRAEECLGPP